MRNRNPFINLKLDPEKKGRKVHLLWRERKKETGSLRLKVRTSSVSKSTNKKDSRITIRLNSRDLERIKVRAKENFLPYQTLISSILHAFARGKLKIEL